MRLPGSDQALIQSLLDSGQHSLNSLAREINVHRNTLVRILKGDCQAGPQTKNRLMSYYILLHQDSMSWQNAV